MENRFLNPSHTSGASPLPQAILMRWAVSFADNGACIRYRQSSPMYWNTVQSHRTMSFQNWLAENFSRSTTVPPATRIAPGACTPPTLWYMGKQLYIRSVACAPIMPANQWLHCMIRAWLTLAALGSPVVPEV